MKHGAAGFTWAKELADKIDPEGNWQLDETDYGYTVGFASVVRDRAFHLRRVGCNYYGPAYNLNDLPLEEREQELIALLAR